MEKCYVKALKLVSSRYDSNYEYFNILVLALSTLLYKYKDKEDLVESIFKDVDIYIEKESIENVLKRNNIEIVEFGNEEDIIDDMGISHNGYDFIFENNKVVISKAKPFIICNSSCNNTELLNTFIHEFNHLIKFRNETSNLDKPEYTIRNGIGYFRCIYKPNTDVLYEYDYYHVFDEVINVIETTEMMENIELLPIDNLDIDRSLLSVDMSYELCVDLIRPLWDNPKFRSLIKDNIIDGSIDNIIESFNNTLGENSFERLANYLDDLQYLEDTNNYKKKYYRLKNNIKKMVKEYNNKTSYTYHK